jgi:hypothetical protein
MGEVAVEMETLMSKDTAMIWDLMKRVMATRV